MHVMNGAKICKKFIVTSNLITNHNMKRTNYNSIFATT